MSILFEDIGAIYVVRYYYYCYYYYVAIFVVCFGCFFFVRIFANKQISRFIDFGPKNGEFPLSRGKILVIVQFKQVQAI